MKKLYESPKVRIVTVRTNAMIAVSWDKEDTSGIDPTPGGQSNFGSKEEEDIYFGW